MKFYGKAPARPGAMKLNLVDYVDKRKLPPVPEVFGHTDLIGADWSMLANDQAGCCVFSGGGHETMLWNKVAGRDVAFTDEGILSDYAAVTGFDPSKTDADGNNPTDQGTDMVVAAEYRRTTGLIDAQGKRHKIAAYLALDPNNLGSIWAAAYLFGAVGIGLQLPDTAEHQFDAGQDWHYVKGHPPVPDNGHYVPLLARREGALHLISWARDQRSSMYYLAQYADEAVTYVSEEMLTGGRSREGFDRESLIFDLDLLKAA